MKRLSGIISKIWSSSFAGLNWRRGITVFCAVSIMSVSGSYCFRENVLQKVERYQSEETAAEAPYYVEILSVSPINGAVNVSVASTIVVEFNDNIDMATVNNTTFTVTDGITPVAGEFSYDAQLKTITFTPGTIAVPVNLLPSTLFNVNLTTGIKNVSGESMAADYPWSFTTGAALNPEIYIVSPLADMFTGDTYDFGSLVNPSTTSQTFTIVNSGTSNLTISGTALSGVNSTEFSISSFPSTPVASGGGTTTFTIVFQPAAAVTPPEEKNAILTITNNDADEGSFIINLTGTGLAVVEPEIQITNGGTILVSPDSTVDFGTVAAGDTETITLIMYNIGSTNLVVPANGVSIGGTNPDLFSTDFGAALTTIIPGATKSFNVSFSSTAKINARATIIFQNNDSDEAPFTIKLKGRVK